MLDKTEIFQLARVKTVYKNVAGEIGENKLHYCHTKGRKLYSAHGRNSMGGEYVREDYSLVKFKR